MHNIILRVLLRVVDPMEQDIPYLIRGMGRIIIQKITIPLLIKVSPARMQRKAKSYIEEARKESKSQNTSRSFIIKRSQNLDLGS
jgi:hypothetical protein